MDPSQNAATRKLAKEAASNKKSRALFQTLKSLSRGSCLLNEPAKVVLQCLSVIRPSFEYVFEGALKALVKSLVALQASSCKMSLGRLGGGIAPLPFRSHKPIGLTLKHACAPFLMTQYTLPCHSFKQSEPISLLLNVKLFTMALSARVLLPPATPCPDLITPISVSRSLSKYRHHLESRQCVKAAL